VAGSRKRTHLPFLHSFSGILEQSLLLDSLAFTAKNIVSPMEIERDLDKYAGEGEYGPSQDEEYRTDSIEVPEGVSKVVFDADAGDSLRFNLARIVALALCCVIGFVGMFASESMSAMSEQVSTVSQFSSLHI